MRALQIEENHVAEPAGPSAKVLFRRVLLSADPEKVQVVFVVAVLAKYREAGLPIKRTNSAGRVSAAAWKIDFGIAADSETIHASLGDLFRLPETEREHWAMHLANAGLSENELKMILHPGSCVDDGDIRDW